MSAIIINSVFKLDHVLLSFFAVTTPSTQQTLKQLEITNLISKSKAKLCQIEVEYYILLPRPIKTRNAKK